MASFLLKSAITSGAAERSCRKLIYVHEVDKGGHFAAWEQPGLFAAEIRVAFRSLRWKGEGDGAHNGRALFPSTRGSIDSDPTRTDQ